MQRPSRGGNPSGFELPCVAPIISRHCSPIFQCFIFSRSKVHPRHLQARQPWTRPQRLNLRGAFNHPRRAPTAFDAASHRYLLPVCPGSESVVSSVILIGRPPNKTFGANELNHARGTIAEICRLVGRDTQG